MKLKNCPFCGGQAKLEKYNESIDGRYDELPYIFCECGAKMPLLYKELDELKKEVGYYGGYLSDHKELWDKMHEATIEKWNTRDNSFEEIVKDHHDYWSKYR